MIVFMNSAWKNGNKDKTNANEMLRLKGVLDGFVLKRVLLKSCRMEDGY